MMKKIPWKWLVAGLVLLLVAGGVMRALAARKAQQASVEQAASAKVQSVVELAATDVVKADTRDLQRGLPVSGSLKAVNSAFVKARIAGELQGLTLREGDAVKAGQMVARVDATEARARLK